MFKAKKKDPLKSYVSCVFRLDWLNVVETMKQQCNAIAIGFIQ